MDSKRGTRIGSYKDLEIYRESFQLAMEMHEVTLRFPKFETVEEGSQLRKSSKAFPLVSLKAGGEDITRMSS